MARKTALAALAGIGSCLLAIAMFHLPGPLAAGFICVACATAGGMALLLMPPGSAPRKVYRVRYHAPADPPDAVRIGTGLYLLAVHGGWVDLIWQRQAGALTLSLECGPASADWLPTLLNQILPDVLLEPVATSSTPCAGICGRWPLAGAATGVPFFDAPSRLTEERLFAGDLEVRLHLAVEGGAVLVQGTPSVAAYQAGFRRWWGPPRLLAWLWQHYRLWEPWPRAGPLALHFPITDGPGTESLDSRRSWVIPLPADYQPPLPDTPRLYLGRTLADGQPIEIAANPAPDSAGGTRRGHFGLLGGAADRAFTLSAIIAGARVRGVSVVYIHAANQRSHSTGQAGSESYLIDFDAPGVSLHWNLLASGSDPPGEANCDVGALRAILTSHVPLLGAALAEGGVIAASSGQGWTMLLDAARLLVINHYRLQRSGEGRQFGPPNLRTVLDLLLDPDGFRVLATHEAEQWAADGSDDSSRENGSSANESIHLLIQEVLGPLLARLTTGDAAVLRQTAAGLRERLVPFVCHPRLVAWWEEPLTAPGAVLNSRPGTLVDILLPANGDNSTALAAHRFSLYLLACLIALAAERVETGQCSPPILLVLEDGIPWWRGALLNDHLPLLAQAGIAVLTTLPHLPAEPLGSRMLHTIGTWWLHTLDPADTGRLAPALRAWGVPEHITLTGLPPGVALLKIADQQRPLVTTVRLDEPEEVA